jgi:LPS-assembly protein
VLTFLPGPPGGKTEVLCFFASPSRLVLLFENPMACHSRFHTTAHVVCHLLLAFLVVTSQLHGQQTPAVLPQNSRPLSQSGFEPKQPSPIATPQRRQRPFGSQASNQEVTISARQQEKVGDVYRLTGNVEIHYRDLALHAEEITYDAATGEANASGRVILEGGVHDIHIEASRATYNFRSQNGEFHEVFGATGVRFHQHEAQFTSSHPFYFQGRLAEKLGPDRIVVHSGRVTSCDIPRPKWAFSVSRANVELGKDAKLYHTTFRIFSVPIFYLPFLQHSVTSVGRETGFLIPTIGRSSRRGTVLGESFYWAINRSMDTTFGGEYMSKRGWAETGEFRVRPSKDSFLNTNIFAVQDRGIGQPPVSQSGQDMRLNGELLLPHQVRAVADIEYLSSFVFRLAFAQTFSQAVNSEVRSNAFVTKTQNGSFYNLRFSRYQNFQSATRGDLITLVRAPSVDLDGVERSLGSTPLHWSYDVALAGVSRREPALVTDSIVGRADIYPRLSLPLQWRGWSFRPEVGLRDTYYTQSLLPDSGLGTLSGASVNRQALETSFELRPPPVSRIFDHTVFGHTLKHTIEPRATYRYVTGVDNASSIIRFDWRDILTDTNEVEYDVVNRLYAKPSHPKGDCATPLQKSPLNEVPAHGKSGVPLSESPDSECATGLSAAKEVVRWELGQKVFFANTFGGALVSGRRNVFATTADFSGIAFVTGPRTFAPLISRLRVATSHNTDLQWNLDYDIRMGRLNASTSIFTVHAGKFFVGGSQAFLRVPGEVLVSNAIDAPAEFNQFRWLVGYGSPTRPGLSAAANIGFDVSQRFLQYSAVQTSYNWDCFGLSFEYRRFALGSVRNENQFRFAFSLTNIGLSLGTLRTQERLF